MPATTPAASGGATTEEEEVELEHLNDWVEEQGLPRGQLAFEHVDPDTGEQKAVFDLAWPEGLQPGLSQPMAVLLNETAERLALANAAGYRSFSSSDSFRAYVSEAVLRLEAA